MYIKWIFKTSQNALDFWTPMTFQTKIETVPQACGEVVPWASDYDIMPCNKN